MQQIKQRIREILFEHKQALTTARKEKGDIKNARNEINHILESQKIVQDVARNVQQKAHEQIASVVSRCLSSVFGEDDAYEFRILFEQKRGRTEAKLVFVRDGIDIDPTTAAGGGVIDVAAFALRLACLLLSQPPRRRFLCLDEPFKMLSKQYQPRIRTLLEELSRELNVQIVFTTHNPALQTGKVITLE